MSDRTYTLTPSQIQQTHAVKQTPTTARSRKSETTQSLGQAIIFTSHSFAGFPSEGWATQRILAETCLSDHSSTLSFTTNRGCSKQTNVAKSKHPLPPVNRARTYEDGKKLHQRTSIKPNSLEIQPSTKVLDRLSDSRLTNSLAGVSLALTA